MQQLELIHPNKLLFVEDQLIEDPILLLRHDRYLLSREYGNKLRCGQRRAQIIVHAIIVGKIRLIWLGQKSTSGFTGSFPQ
jgi:hypothetical protein